MCSSKAERQECDYRCLFLLCDIKEKFVLKIECEDLHDSMQDDSEIFREMCQRLCNYKDCRYIQRLYSIDFFHYLPGVPKKLITKSL